MRRCLKSEWFYQTLHKKNYTSKKEYLQSQIGNPDGADKPNKKYYDPRAWLRSGELTFVKRMKLAFEDLDCLNRNA